jgi:hypothetical protein
MSEEQLKKIFNQKKQKETIKNGKTVIKHGFVNTTFDQFSSWFQQDVFDKGCHYCGTTNQRSNDLYQLQRTGKRYDATRGGKRGRRLELDRKNANRSYDDLDNLVWCCYWCNNAKSNFFSEEEFVPIGAAIASALKRI